MTDRIDIRIQPHSALSRLIAAGKADGRTVAATLHDAVTRLEVLERLHPVGDYYARQALEGKPVR